MPADPRLAKQVAEVLERFARLEPTPEVLDWLSDSDRWRALVFVGAWEGAGAFVLHTISGDPPEEMTSASAGGREGRLVIPFDSPAAPLISELEGARLDDLARASARELELGQAPRAAELTLEIGDDGEPELTVYSGWDQEPADDFRKLPEARAVPRSGRFFARDALWGVARSGRPGAGEGASPRSSRSTRRSTWRGAPASCSTSCSASTSARRRRWRSRTPRTPS